MYLLKENGLILAGLVIVLFAVAAMFVEAAVMFLFKLNRFWKSVSDSLVVNIGSFLLGVLLFLIFNKSEFEGISELTEFGAYYFLTCIFEAWIIKLLNKDRRWARIIAASFVMNLVTFAAMYLVLTLYLSF